MASSRCWRVVALLLSGSLSLTFTARAPDVTAAKAVQPVQTSKSADKIEAQIVRISYLEGDVRVVRGTKGATWEAAVPGLLIGGARESRLLAKITQNPELSKLGNYG